MNKEKYTKKEIIAALVTNKGMVYVAARSIGCAANTIYNFAEKYPEVKEAMKQERGLMVDMAELHLHKAVTKGEPWAVSLTLKTIGKDRGYTERQEFTGADGEPIKQAVTVDLSKMTDEQLANLARTLKD